MKLKCARKRKKLSQKDLAKLIGMSTVGYQKIERGESIPNLKSAIKICAILGVQIHEIDEWKFNIWLHSKILKILFYNFTF